MALSTAVGTSFYVSSTFASAKTVTIATNANPTVLTSTTHGYVDNDELLFLSGWELATNTIYRADQLTTDTLSLLGLDTSNTNNFGSGSGTGTLQKVSSWLEIPNVLSVSVTGGTSKFITYKTVKALQDQVLPNGFEASRIEFELGFDTAAANWSTLLALSRNQTLVAYKSVKGSGAATYGYGYWMVMEDPMEQSDQVTKVRATFARLGRTVTY